MARARSRRQKLPADAVLALPVFPTMTEEQQKIVVDAIVEFFAAKN